jgi:Tfp pilus assembly protein PilF
MNNYRLLLLFAYFSILTAGCASIGSRDLRKQPIASADKKISAAAINSHSKEIVAQGLKYINSGEINKAQELFNVALKFSPDKSELHLLLATTYHLQYLTDGTRENF